MPEGMSLLMVETTVSGSYANLSQNIHDTTMDIPLYILLVVSVISAIIFLVGVIGNASVMYIILANKDMRSSTNVCLFNLSLADMFVLVMCMPSALTEFYGKDVWYLGEPMCKYVIMYMCVEKYQILLEI